ncbi:SRPBCC family protein [uncultured Roseovarius sp.]|uniref:SRPBCC family protein n=1 Tax=uncultured Roseovarius sp. TaxID=293344 RepID=UPI0026027D94|nr:SRPBCC family protein [uncultured Roseovarius sp.]
MKFSAREDIEAPINYVFDQLTDFQAFERSALRRGAEVQRVDNKTVPGVGMAWDIAFKWRGKMRELKMELTGLDAPNCMVLSSRSPSMGGDMMVDLVPLSRGRTRVSMDLGLRPKTLSSRLLVQSLKLARSNLASRYAMRVAELARDLEDRYKRSA